MTKNPMIRRLLFVAVAVAFLGLNPIHLPFSLPYLAREWEGNAAGAFLSRYQSTILVVSTVYFMIATMSFYFWIWSRRPRRTASPSARSSVNGVQHPTDSAYRGPGGGKRAPRPHRRRARR